MSSEYNNVNLEGGSESLFEMYFLLKYLNNTSVVSTDEDTKSLGSYNISENSEYEDILESRKGEFEDLGIPRNTSLLPQAYYWFDGGKKVAYIP